MTDLNTLDLLIRTRARELNDSAVEARLIVSKAKELQEQIVELDKLSTTLDKTTIFLNSIGEERQLKAQSTIEELVTRGLQTIFDSSLSFHILQTTKAKAANVEFVVRTALSNGITVDTAVMDARGGGLAATVGFLLRLVVMLLRGGTNEENVLILDETFSHVSEEYLDTLGQFLREVVDKTGVQIIMVTHQKEFIEFADSVYYFSLGDDGKTIVRQES